MLGTERRATRRHRVRHPRDMCCHDIRVPLDDDDPMVRHDRLFRQIQPVQQLRLLVDGRLGSIQVLGRLLVGVVQSARAKPHRRTRNIADRPHQSAAETIVDAAAALRTQARDLDLLIREAFGAQVARQRIPRGRSIADPEMLTHRLVETALSQERAPPVSLLAAQLLAVELFGRAMSVQEPLALARLLRAHPRPALLVVEGDPRLLREHLHGLGERQVVDLLHKGDDVTALTAPETVEHAQVGAHVEGGRALVMEGTQTLERTDASGSQRYVLADDLVDLDRATYRFDVVLANQTRHNLSLPTPTHVCVRSRSELRRQHATPAGVPRRRRHVRERRDLIDDGAQAHPVVRCCPPLRGEHRLQSARPGLV